MPGFGFGEMLVIAVVVLLAVGPQRLPQVMKTFGKGLRQFRDAATELRRASGIDEIMREDPLGTRRPTSRGRNPLAPLPSTAGEGGDATSQTDAERRAADALAAGRIDPPITAEAVHREYPAEGVDVAHARAHPAASRAAAAPEPTGGTGGEPEGEPA